MNITSFLNSFLKSCNCGTKFAISGRMKDGYLDNVAAVAIVADEYPRQVCIYLQVNLRTREGNYQYYPFLIVCKFRSNKHPLICSQVEIGCQGIYLKWSPIFPVMSVLFKFFAPRGSRCTYQHNGLSLLQ